MRVAYLGPEGTNSHEALLAAAADGGVAGTLEPLALSTIYDCVVAVQRGDADRAFVPIENALEGSVNAALDVLAVEAEDVAIVGEHVHAIHTCLIARTPLRLDAVERVISHPQATGQCAHFLRTRLPQARVLAASSTAEAVRTVSESDEPVAALGSRTAAELYGCEVLHADVDDAAGNETRFVWLATRRRRAGARRARPVEDGDRLLGRRRGGAGLARALPVRAGAPRREPHADRVAPAPAGPRALHVLPRPRGPRHGQRRRRGARGPARARRAPARARVVPGGAAVERHITARYTSAHGHACDRVSTTSANGVRAASGAPAART